MSQDLVARLHHVRSFVRAVNVIRLRPGSWIFDPAYIDSLDNCSGFNIALIVASFPIFCGDRFSLERNQTETHTYGNSL